MKIWEKLEQFPPPLVRCLARQKARGKAVRALSDQEVAIQRRSNHARSASGIQLINMGQYSNRYCSEVLQGM